MKVQIVSRKEEYVIAPKREFLGKVVTIRDVYLLGRRMGPPYGRDYNRPCFTVLEDNIHFSKGVGWSWFEDDIECIVEASDIKQDFDMQNIEEFLSEFT